MLRSDKLAKSAIDYIKQQLLLGGFFSAKINELDLEAGSVFTYLPQDLRLKPSIDYSESLEFLTGEKVSTEFDSLISEIIMNYLDNNERKVAIFETIWNRNDLIVSRRLIDYFTIKGRKYDFLKGGDKKELIMNYITDAKGYPTVISIVDIGDKKIDIIPKSEFDEEKVSELASMTDILIIGAFDGEGYLVWQKNNLAENCYH